MFFMMHIIWTTSVTSIFMWGSSFGDNKWCSEEFDCKIDGAVHKHTMCVNIPKQKRNSFDKITTHTTEDSKKLLLKAHNAYRNTLSTGWTGLPEASNIRQMTWDTTLEELATNWAMQCNPGHDSCRKTHQFSQVGQNVGMTTYKEDSPTVSLNLFEAWKKGFQDIQGTSSADTLIHSFKNGSWKDGTQLTWAETTKVGCGEVSCHQKQTNFRVLVCNYGPSGNIENHEIYKTGDPCDHCPAGTKCKEKSDYPNLCALPNDPTDSSLGIPKSQTEREDEVTKNTREKGSTSNAGKTTKLSTQPVASRPTASQQSASQPTASQQTASRPTASQLTTPDTLKPTTRFPGDTKDPIREEGQPIISPTHPSEHNYAEEQKSYLSPYLLYFILFFNFYH